MQRQAPARRLESGWCRTSESDDPDVKPNSLNLTCPEDDHVGHLASVFSMFPQLIVVDVCYELIGRMVLSVVKPDPLDDVLEPPTEALGIDAHVVGRNDLGNGVDEGHVDVYKGDSVTSVRQVSYRHAFVQKLTHRDGPSWAVKEEPTSTLR